MEVQKVEEQGFAERRYELDFDNENFWKSMTSVQRSYSTFLSENVQRFFSLPGSMKPDIPL
jgi:hypothetical protein